MKRLFDIIASAIGLVCISPLLVVVAVWIKLDSSGPVFYRQQRIGRNGKPFGLYKFRSMCVGADRKGLITVGGHDSRVTHAGYYIRKYKLDELPQLINVLVGDMSLVGPRPEVKRYVDLYDDQQLRVLSVRPGITDPASIKYRNENELLSTATDPEEFYRTVVMPDKLRINLDYVDHQSFVGDIKIIAQTFRAILQ